MTSIFALDLAKRTGWARLHEGVLDSGIVNFGVEEGEQPGRRWPRVRAWIRDAAAGADLLAWEAVVNFGGVFSMSSLYGLEAQVVEVAAELGCRTLTVMPVTLKKFATGSGRAKKDEILSAARRRWPGHTFASHDEADARFVLEWARARQEVLA